MKKKIKSCNLSLFNRKQSAKSIPKIGAAKKYR